MCRVKALVRPQPSVGSLGLEVVLLTQLPHVAVDGRPKTSPPRAHHGPPECPQHMVSGSPPEGKSIGGTGNGFQSLTLCNPGTSCLFPSACLSSWAPRPQLSWHGSHDPGKQVAQGPALSQMWPYQSHRRNQRAGWPQDVGGAQARSPKSCACLASAV
jgi:hypothetical protein